MYMMKKFGRSPEVNKRPPRADCGVEKTEAVEIANRLRRGSQDNHIAKDTLSRDVVMKIEHLASDMARYNVYGLGNYVVTLTQCEQYHPVFWKEGTAEHVLAQTWLALVKSSVDSVKSLQDTNQLGPKNVGTNIETDW